MDFASMQNVNLDEKDFIINILDKNNEVFNHLLTGSTECSKFRIKKSIEPDKPWDLMKLLEFLSYMPLHFRATTPVRTQKERNKYHWLMLVLENKDVIMEFYFSKNLDQHMILMIKWTNWIRSTFLYNETPIQIPGYCVSKHCFLKEHEEAKDHPYNVFRRFFGRNSKAPSKIVLDMFQSAFIKIRENQFDMISFVQNLPGYCKIYYQDYVQGSYKIDNNRFLQRLVWICPWAKSRIDVTNYLELDASFRAISPYCYCIINSIANNESLPIGISICGTECLELYNEAYVCLLEIGICREKLKSLPILTDLGKALKAFALKWELTQYYCHRHILETFGNPFQRSWVKRILECGSISDYIDVSEQIKIEINLYLNNNKDEINDNFIKKLNNILEMLDSNNSETSDYHQKKWAIWNRIENKIARCTNHSESFHSVLNKKSYNLRIFPSKFKSIIKNIFKKYMNMNITHGRAIFDKIRKIEQLKRTILEQNMNRIPYSKETCECGYTKYYSSLYGVPIPCKHQIFNENFQNIKPPPLIKLNLMENFPLKEIVSKEKMIIQLRNKSHVSKSLIKYNKVQITCGNLTPNLYKAKIAFFNVIKEISSIFYIDHELILDFAYNEFISCGLGKEETATKENIALFRLSCWKTGENIKKSANLKLFH